MFTAFSHTMAGRKRNLTARTANEDRVLIRTFHQAKGGPAVMAVVADGVSRCADGGAVANWLIHERLAVDDFLNGPNAQLPGLIRTYLKRVHQDFIERFEENDDMMESATTLAGVVVQNGKACIFWSGDSPVHLLRLREGRLHGETLTSPDKIHGTPMLTDCFSGLTAFDFRTRVVDVRAGDFLVCATDGLVPEAKELAVILSERPFSKEWAEEICTDSYNVPGSDDIGVAAIRID
jgi:serine/threonine protein phosphatase PrpC